MRIYATCLHLVLAVPAVLPIVAWPGAGWAQETTYVQIEAHPDLAEAQERARAYGGLLPDVNGFALGGGWYGLALGPYDAPAARAALRRLRADGLIPRDSYVTEGGTYRQRFWPAEAQAADPAPEAPAATGAGSEGEAAAPVPDTEETLREARASEAALSPEARMDLQRALQWFGLYDAGIDGSFGGGTRASMAAWQEGAGVEATGVLTTLQRARLLEAHAASRAALGLERLDVPEAGLSLTAPAGLVTFDRIEAPFVHYAPAGDSGVRLSLISQPGDSAALAGLYEILQTLEILPEEGERSRARDSFRIRGEGGGRGAEAFARLEGGHVIGYVLNWPDAREGDAARALVEMERTLVSTGAPLDPGAGFDPAEQSPDMVSGLDRRSSLRAGAGIFVDAEGTVATAAATVAECGRVTLDEGQEATVALSRDGVAVLRPEGRLVPVEVAAFAPREGRLGAPVSVAGFPYGGALGAATLSFGTLEDVRGLDGAGSDLRLSVRTREGDAGGAVLDAAGRVTGMLLPDPDDARALPADVALARKAGAVVAVLEEAGIAPILGPDAPAIAPEDLTARAVGMTVLVSCWE